MGMISSRQAAMATMGLIIYLDDVDAHHARADAAGATSSVRPHDEFYGRTYTVHTSTDTHGFFTTPPPSSRGGPAPAALHSQVPARCMVLKSQRMRESNMRS
jgi:hypothetical protein